MTVDERIEEAEEIHALARGTDPAHDQVECWACCTDCDWDDLA